MWCGVWVAGSVVVCGVWVIRFMWYGVCLLQRICGILCMLQCVCMVWYVRLSGVCGGVCGVYVVVACGWCALGSACNMLCGLQYVCAVVSYVCCPVWIAIYLWYGVSVYVVWCVGHGVCGVVFGLGCLCGIVCGLYCVHCGVWGYGLWYM